MKKILSSLLSIALLMTTVASVHAAGPKLLFEVDCDTLNKNVKIGFHADEDDPQNGPEIIAYEFTMSLTPTTGSTLADLSNAKFTPNSAVTNMIVAQNTSNTVGNAQVLQIAGGFTQQTGLSTSEHIFSITGIEQKAYKITVDDGQMYPKTSNDDIYSDTPPKKSFTADPSVCTSNNQNSNNQTANNSSNDVVIENFSYTPAEITVSVGDTVEWTNNDSTAHTVTSVNAGPLDSGNIAAGEKFSHTFTEAGTFDYQCTIHPSMTGRVIVEAASGSNTNSGTNTTNSNTSQNQAPQGDIEITMSASPETANPNDEVEVTAIIKNRSAEAIEWSQTEGNRIAPTIDNSSLDTGDTQSILKFAMPSPATDVTVRIKVGDATETFTVNGADTTTTNAAGTDTTDTNTDTTAGQDGTDSTSLQERLQQRREELASTNQPATTSTTDPSGTVHSAAGAGLARSGPEHVAGFMALISGIIVFGMQRRRKAFEEL